MKRAVCSVADSASALFGQPVFVPAPGAALRSFSDEVNRRADDNVLNKHPDDYTLWFIAEFDDETGAFSLPEGGPRVLARGKDLIVKES